MNDLDDKDLMFLIQYLRSRFKHPTMTGTSDQAILIDLKAVLKRQANERKEKDTNEVS